MAKAITPAYKKVYRFYDKDTGYALGDVITLFDERIPKNKYTLIDPLNEHNKLTIKNYNVRELQEAIFVGGELVYQDPTIEEKQRYCDEQMGTLYPEVKRIENPHLYYIDLSRKLLQLKKELIRQAKEQTAQNAVDYQLTKKI
jgi:nicotinate phosphoribosyltransferase